MTIRLAALSIAVVSLGVLACFSERAPTTTTVATATCTAPTSTAGSTIVFIRDFTFQPAAVHVKSGQSVAWVNCEPAAIPHTSTSDAAGWNSGLMQQDAVFIRSFSTVGSFPYHCGVHLSMKATVIVE